MRIRNIILRLDADGWDIDDTQYGKVIARKDGHTVVAENWNKLYFTIYKPKKK